MTCNRSMRSTLAVLVALATLSALSAAVASAQTPGMSLLTDQANPNDWPMYHRGYDATRYSPLSQINRSNVKNLTVAWIHQPGKIEQGLESTPIAIDGVLYYSAAYNRVFALDGATGKEIWHYYPRLDPVVNTLFFQPFNRGIAYGHDKIFMGLLDGGVVAVEAKTGKEVWRNQVLNTKKCSCNFTAAPIVVKDKVVIGQTAGEYPIQGYIYALNAADGRVVWKFNTIKEDQKSWGGDSGRFGGGGGWMTGSYDPERNLVFWGTSNPAPDYDWGNARPGDNLYTSSPASTNTSPWAGETVTRCGCNRSK